MIDPAAYFRGDWRIERRLRDRRAGLAGRFEGAARFEPAPGGLRYEERGTMAYGAHRGPARQGYHYACGPGARVAVRFEDGRPFHAMDLARGVADFEYRCGPDHYRGRLRLAGPGRWRLLWRVTGPRKDLAISSRYERDQGDARQP